MDEIVFLVAVDPFLFEVVNVEGDVVRHKGRLDGGEVYTGDGTGREPVAHWGMLATM